MRLGDLPSNPIRVLAADYHGLIREGLKRGLEGTGDFVVETVGDFDAALKQAFTEPQVPLRTKTACLVVGFRRLSRQKARRCGNVDQGGVV